MLNPSSWKFRCLSSLHVFSHPERCGHTDPTPRFSSNFLAGKKGSKVMGAIWKAQKQQLGKDSQIVCFFSCLLRFVWFLVMCKLSTCCLFLLIQFFWHFCFCWKIFNVYAQPKHPESSPENPGVCSNIVPPLNRSPSLEHVVPWHIFNGTGPVWLFPASLLPCSWKKNELQARDSSNNLSFGRFVLIINLTSTIILLHELPQNHSYVSLPQGYDDVTRPCSVRWAGLGEGISHPAVKALIQSHLDRMALVG